MGAMLPFRPAGWDTIDEAYKDEDGAFVTVSVNVITYAVNTERVATADVPKSALDFLKPMFAGKLITTDPTDDDAALAVFNSIVQKYGWSFLDKYAAQKPAFVTTGHAAVSDAIVSGDKLASFDSTSSTWRLMRDGKPIAVFRPTPRRSFWSAPGSSRRRRTRTPRGSTSPGFSPRSSRAARARSRRARMWCRRRGFSRCRPCGPSTAATGIW